MREQLMEEVGVEQQCQHEADPVDPPLKAGEPTGGCPFFGAVQNFPNIRLIWRRATATVHFEAAIRVWIADHVVADGECWVAELPGGRIVAMLHLRGSWIEQLYVAPDHQRSGIGGALLTLAATRSPDRLQLWTFETNAAARRFYERHGFVCVQRTDGAGNEERAADRRYLREPAGVR